MNNYKIKVNNEPESREAQELFFELGYEWNGSGKEVVSWRLGLLFTKDFQGKNCLCYFDKDEDVMLDGWAGKELTLPELRDLVVLHRNDVNDATHKHIGGAAAYKTVDEIAYMWTRMGWEYKGVAHDLLLIHKENEQGLISGADALRALADGKEVQCTITGKNDWTKDIYGIQPYYFLGGGVGQFQFRLKPRTITLNVEIPSCGTNYKHGQLIWILNSLEPKEYCSVILDESDELPAYWWKSEEQVKQVVAALRGGIKG